MEKNSFKKENAFLVIIKNFKRKIVNLIDKDGRKKEKAIKYVNIASDKLPIKAEKNLKIKIVVSIFSAFLVCLLTFFILKITTNAKEDYSAFTQISSSNKTDEQEHIEEKEKELSKDNGESLRIDPQAFTEELDAKSNSVSYAKSFEVSRDIEVIKKIHIYNEANWNSANGDILPNEKVTVDKMISVNGYMMYKISSGENAGKYLTANENLVKVVNKKDDINNEFLEKKQNAIKLLSNVPHYSNISLSKSLGDMYKGNVLNITGIGVSKNNKLTYYVSNGTFITLSTNVVEVEREKQKDTKKEDDKKTSKNSNTKKNKR